MASDAPCGVLVGPFLRARCFCPNLSLVRGSIAGLVRVPSIVVQPLFWIRSTRLPSSKDVDVGGVVARVCRLDPHFLPVRLRREWIHTFQPSNPSRFHPSRVYLTVSQKDRRNNKQGRMSPSIPPKNRARSVCTTTPLPIPTWDDVDPILATTTHPREPKHMRRFMETWKNEQ